MAKLKKSFKPNNDTMVAAIVLGLFVVVIILFVVFSKGKEAHHGNVIHKPNELHKKKAHVITEGVDAYIPNENPVEQPMPASQPIENIPGSGGKIAFIIDDWGQTTANCKYLKDIPEPIAVSILPGLRHTKDVAACAQLNHKLAMLHLPLEALHNSDFYPPNYIIKTTMAPELASKIIDGDLDQLPSIEGVNNHMGSKATENEPLMKLIFKKLKKRSLFFVDSMTAHNTVCAKLADDMDLAFGKRDVFLDNINTREAITEQMMILAKKARHRGYAVAIGHDRHLTMQVLKDEIPLLEAQGFQIVSIKTLLKNK
jgi:polysaccharide deacetylase 2 family uncharacterized protein YibQ